MVQIQFLAETVAGQVILNMLIFSFIIFMVACKATDSLEQCQVMIVDSPDDQSGRLLIMLVINLHQLAIQPRLHALLVPFGHFRPRL